MVFKVTLRVLQMLYLDAPLVCQTGLGQPVGEVDATG
jgi:hypothetical protein